MRWCGVVLMAGLAASGARAADRGFDEVVRALADQFGSNPVRIPFFGLANAFLKVAHPAGAKHVDFAVFENPRYRDGANTTAVVRAVVGAPWQPFVEVRSTHHGRDESVLVYLRQQHQDWDLLVTSIERDEAVVAQIRLNPDGLRRWMASPLDCARHWRGESGR